MALTLQLDLTNLTAEDLITFTEHVRGHNPDDISLTYNAEDHTLTLRYTPAPGTTYNTAPTSQPGTNNDGTSAPTGHAPTDPTTQQRKPPINPEDIFNDFIRDIKRRTGTTLARDGAERIIRDIVDQVRNSTLTPNTPTGTHPTSSTPTHDNHTTTQRPGENKNNPTQNNGRTHSHGNNNHHTPTPPPTPTPEEEEDSFGASWFNNPGDHHFDSPTGPQSDVPNNDSGNLDNAHPTDSDADTDSDSGTNDSNGNTNDTGAGNEK